jgi:hypothetical protein
MKSSPGTTVGFVMSRRSANRSRIVDGEPSAADVCALSAKVQEPTRAGFLDHSLLL